MPASSVVKLRSQIKRTAGVKPVAMATERSAERLKRRVLPRSSRNDNPSRATPEMLEADRLKAAGFGPGRWRLKGVSQDTGYDAARPGSVSRNFSENGSILWLDCLGAVPRLEPGHLYRWLWVAMIGATVGCGTGSRPGSEEQP